MLNATSILAGDFEAGDTVKVGFRGKSFTFERAESVEPELIEDT